ncbi:MAG TPA: tail fiber domain-containing protein [Phycisphaerales bacterium]|nr:tail fiber domain-containing protein [Phycisphaerales bacterium]
MMQVRTVFAAAAVSLVSLLASAGAHGQTYTNATPITIPANGSGLPYPSSIDVSGGPASIQSVTVAVRGLEHTSFPDVDVLLVGPGGQRIQLMNSPPGSATSPGMNVFFVSEGGASQAPGLSDQGVYQPSGGNTVFAPPAPPLPYASTFGGVIGTNANGTWSLYVRDNVAADSGIINGGWSITFGAPPSPLTALDDGLTYQGRLTDASGNALSGTANLRFSLWDAPGSDNQVNRVGNVITQNDIAIGDNGIITTTVNFGRRVPSDRATWLQVEVASPPGSGFVALAPRQRIAAAPLARAVATSPFTAGALVGSSGIVGINQHDTANQGAKARVGYAIDPAGQDEFAGMLVDVRPSTTFCGNTADLSFFTWECNTAFSREVMRINGSGNVGIGTTAPRATLDVTTGPVGTGWQTVWNNTAAAAFRGGARLSDAGFFEVTNAAATSAPNFARLASTGAWTAVSDGRLKTDVSPIQNQLTTAMKLKPVNFRWKATGAADFGLIAQDVRGVLPSLVVGDEATESLTVNYSQLSVVAIGAIQEQQREIDALKAKLAELEAALAAITANK